MNPALPMPLRPSGLLLGSRQLLPASWVVLWEMPFWFILAFGSLVPATLVPRLEWFGIPMKLSDLLTLASAAFYGAGGAIHFIFRRNSLRSGGLVAATMLLFAYGAVRLFTGGLEVEDQLAMGFALLLSASAPVQAAGIFSVYEPRQTKEFLNRLVLFVAIVSLIYTAESVLGLGLRSEAGVNFTSDFGIQRVRGPLYGSSTGYLLLLPAIGWSIGSFFVSAAGKSYSAFTTVTLLSAYLGLGSRAGLILLVLFMGSILMLLKQLKRSEGTALLFAGLCIAAGFLIYVQADTQRLTQFEDTHRRLTHETAANIVSSEPLPAILAGQGYGSIWPWYRRDTLRAELVAIGDNTVSTGFGPSLYHSHSTLLELAIEFGLPGVCWLAYALYCTGRLLFRLDGGIGWRVFALSLLVSFCALGFDLFLFKEVRVNSVWWLFAVAAFQLPRQEVGVQR